MALTDFENTIRIYMEQRLRELYPEVMMSGSTLSDLYINPLIEINKPLILWLNKIDRMQSLYNYEYMTSEELDVIGEGNYGIYRRLGSKASGYVHVEMDADYVGPGLVLIPIISVSTTSSNLKFKSRTNTLVKITETDSVTAEGTLLPGLAVDYLNTSTGKYEFPVYVEAEEYGIDYNIESNEINRLLTDYSLLTGVVTNKEPFSNGMEMESNKDYAMRIRQEPVTRAVGTEAWYRNYALANFSEAYNLYIAGFGNKLMDRDRVLIRENNDLRDIHIGGKVDLYVVGSNIDTHTQKSYINTNKIRLLNPRLKSEDAILVKNITNPANNPLQLNLIYENPATKTGYVEAEIVGPLLPNVGDELEFRYISHIDDSYTDTLVYKQYIYYRNNKIRLERTPFKYITEVLNTTTGVEVALDIPDIFNTSRVLPVVEISMCPDQAGIDLNMVKLDEDKCIPIYNYYKDNTIEIIQGTGAGQTRIIESFDNDTLVAVIDTPWDIQPTYTSKYKITSHTNKVENSAKDIIDVEFDMSAITPGTISTTFNMDDLLEIKYVYNKLIYDIQEDSDIQENRSIGADVLAREGIPEYVYIGLQVKCKYGRLLKPEQRLTIQTILEEEIIKVDFDSELQMSDLINALYQVPDVSLFMDYIIMPPIFFKSTEIQDYTDGEFMELVGPEFHKSVIDFKDASYPILAKCVVIDAE